MEKIKNVIFDIGNVLFKYEPRYIAEQLLPKEENLDFYLDNLFHADHWDLLDRGDLSSKQLIRDLSKRLDLSSEQKANFQLLLDKFPEHLILNEEMKAVFDACAKEHNVYILSNFQYPVFNVLLKNHEFLNQAKGMVISGRVMMMKPEIGIYHYLITQQRIIPQQSVFIDDRSENILSAKRVLMKGIVYKNAKQTKKELEKLKVKIA